MDRLDNTVRPYAWGSTTAIPTLLGTEPTGEPQAEMWMGAHPGAPSRTGRGTSPRSSTPTPRRNWAPRPWPGSAPGCPSSSSSSPPAPALPPGPPRPRPGQGRLRGRGAPRRPPGRPHRNYKDANHKPELVCALTDFDGLCGFRAPAETADLLDGLGVASLKPYVDLLRAHPEDAALREVLTAILTADPEEMSHTVTETAAACDRLGGAYRPYADIAHHYPGDPGVLAAMLLNHVRLQPGEALYLGAGIPHAYLNGLGVEIMANSDNVLRCGLTPKHVDVPELLRIVRFEAGDPGILRPEASPDGEEVYDTPIDEFRLSRYVLPEGAGAHDLTLPTPQILLCTAGTVRAGEHELAPGRSVFVPAHEKAEVSGTGTLFRATVRV